MSIQISYKRLQQMASEEGFTAVGVSRAECVCDEEEREYLEWLNEGRHGEMSYLSRNIDKRMDPRLLVPGARSIVTLLVPYKQRIEEATRRNGRVASFAWLEDYHITLKKRLYSLLNRLQNEYGGIEGRPFVDSAPLYERYWAVRAGLGWIGKNTLLVTREWGSFVFIGSLVINADVEITSRGVKNLCGTCQRCVEACPTGALIKPRYIDARLCISYLTIEKRGGLSREEVSMLDGWAFGCDTCQNVCPWNIRNENQDSGRLTEVHISHEELNNFTIHGNSLPKNTCLSRADSQKLRNLLREL